MTISAVPHLVSQAELQHRGVLDPAFPLVTLLKGSRTAQCVPIPNGRDLGGFMPFKPKATRGKNSAD